jgi:hypothetical protein
MAPEVSGGNVRLGFSDEDGIPSGAKAHLHFAAIMARLKPRPFKSTEFFSRL